MHEIILITKEDCQKCDWVKSKIPDGFVEEIELHDAKTPDGMMWMAYYELFQFEQFPLLVVDDVVIHGAIKINNKLKELVELNA